jgi:hypothetical protein
MLGQLVLSVIIQRQFFIFGNSVSS